MQNHDFGPQPTINFEKVVSVPTISSWSQAYNAGKLLAVLSLEKVNDQEDSDSLNILGKDLLGKLEEEFFTLDNKDSSSIKQAILNTFKDEGGKIKYSFAASFFANNKLYIFIIGKASVFVKRGSKIARFKSDLQKDPRSVVSFAGKVEDNDLIVLTTDYSSDFLEDAFLEDRSVHEITDIITPVVLEKEDGKISVVILKYIHPKPLIDKEDQEDGDIKETKETNGIPIEKKSILTRTPNLKKYIPIKNIRLTHSKKVFLTLAVIVLVIFVSSIFLAVRKQESSKIQAIFEEAYNQAEKKYNEGDSILALNKNVARENFLEAKEILNEAIPQFPKRSKEEKQAVTLLQKVEKAIAASSGVNLVDAEKIDEKQSIYLSLQMEKQFPFAQDETDVYFVDSDAVYSVSKSERKEKEIIKNNNFWENSTSLGAYLGNIYVLDKSQKQILKFAAIRSGYGQSNYFSNDVAPDFSKATSMAIDGSIYVLSSDGTIQKFTSGNPEKFTILGLDTPFFSPSKIFTDRDASNIYILDNGNSRIVALNKEGVYSAQYQTEILKNAQDFEVLEEEKKIFVLSGTKLYLIDLK